MMLRHHAADPTSMTGIRAYYQSLYGLHSEKNFDACEIINCFEKDLGKPNFDFKTAAKRFQLIDDNTVGVIILYDDTARQLLEALPYTPYPLPIVRKLQRFTVNIFQREFDALQSLGAIQTLHERYHVLDARWLPTYYHPQTGLVLIEPSGGEAVFFD